MVYKRYEVLWYADDMYRLSSMNILKYGTITLINRLVPGTWYVVNIIYLNVRMF